jgi:peptidoglycan/xylan/chitin deacetylase (PgdA/CDA1 family)
MADKTILCAFGTDIDAVAGWIGSYGGADSPSDIQRGIFAGEVGTTRLLKLFKKYDLKTTFFIPGHSIETFPDQTKRIVDEGHEVGAHGYLHENPIALTPTQEEAVLERSIELIEKYSGMRPRGYVAPWWEMSKVTADLLKKHGFTYDHSQGYRDFLPFYARVGDNWTTIDYSKTAQEWMKPLVHGKEIDLVGIAANWYVDDLPPMMFIKSAPNSHGFVNPRDIEDLWRDQFDWVYREMDYGIFPLTIHPDVSGRPQVLLMLERLIEYINGHDGIRWVTFDEIAQDFRTRFPFDSNKRPELI